MPTNKTKKRTRRRQTTRVGKSKKQNRVGGYFFIKSDAASDIKLKKDITSLTSGLDEILKLNPVNFKWKKGGQRNNIGLIAQEVEKVIPDAVSKHNDTKHISYNMLTSTLIKAVQELNDKL